MRGLLESDYSLYLSGAENSNLSFHFVSLLCRILSTQGMDVKWFSERKIAYNLKKGGRIDLVN